ncbi:MAG TPA: hypothetical protein VHS05_03005 [Pyrinomonadaceae bacterium]|jgi:hypothetical protein|nr:hypothetical protein [Pyrinomonadaceae bacterium]
MLTRIKCVLCTLLVGLVASTVWGQASLADFQKTLEQKAAFQSTDFAALQLNQPVVRLAPTVDKREIAVSGLVNVRADADEFLRSYRDSMTRKTNPAILEIGSFGPEANLNDLAGLTLDPGDIEDLKDCVVGDCELKLSAAMIARFRKEIDWTAPNYQLNVTNLFKQMLLDYVRDYRTRGEAALIEYNDKRDEVSLAAEQHALNDASSYINDFLSQAKPELHLAEDSLVWSKIKFGLKPVISINHVRIYRRSSDTGPQVLIASNQIYANHYFNASLALTAFVNVPGVDQGAYLVYENRSRADGLEGPFGKIKRGVVEKKALEGLKAILAHSQASLGGSPLTASTEDYAAYQSYGWGHRLFGGIRPLLWLLVLSALIALLVLGKLRVDNISASKAKALKPESVKS